MERAFEFEAWTDVPTLQHEITYQGREYTLEIDRLGHNVWCLTDEDGRTAEIGRRKRWQDALRDALVIIAEDP